MEKERGQEGGRSSYPLRGWSSVTGKRERAVQADAGRELHGLPTCGTRFIPAFSAARMAALAPGPVPTTTTCQHQHHPCPAPPSPAPAQDTVTTVRAPTWLWYTAIPIWPYGHCDPRCVRVAHVARSSTRTLSAPPVLITLTLT